MTPLPPQVMSVVKSLVKDGTTICATIHSPTSFCFSLFDKLMMMVRGRIVYFGKQGERCLFVVHNFSPCFMYVNAQV